MRRIGCKSTEGNRKNSRSFLNCTRVRYRSHTSSALTATPKPQCESKLKRKSLKKCFQTRLWNRLTWSYRGSPTIWNRRSWPSPSTSAEKTSQSTKCSKRTPLYNNTNSPIWCRSICSPKRPTKRTSRRWDPRRIAKSSNGEESMTRRGPRSIRRSSICSKKSPFISTVSTSRRWENSAS